ncbi:uncharacterized protein LOC129316431 [Prosopis cineraria]|uniref:uncharacterized protein LOC129316431 n=1 Tax=Prosopis cineraria TaxID=364024 RepID=UPI00240F6220|nr:uncharacterized protein LOC129316431 [Prosopis cineraria]
MTQEEARASQNLIKDIISICGNRIKALFDSRATFSFISEEYVDRLKLELKELPMIIKVTTPFRSTSITSKVCLKVKIVFADEVSVINLICIPMKGIDVIVGMDWLAANNVMLDCARKLVSLPLSLKIVYYRGIEKIGVVSEFLEISSEEISRLPPEREVEFSIDLVPDTELISKAPYRMSPSELNELKKQIDDLLNKGFIRLSVSPWGLLVLFVRKKDDSL